MINSSLSKDSGVRRLVFAWVICTTLSFQAFSAIATQASVGSDADTTKIIHGVDSGNRLLISHLTMFLCEPVYGHALVRDITKNCKGNESEAVHNHNRTTIIPEFVMDTLHEPQQHKES